MRGYPYESPRPPRRDRETLEERARKIAMSEGRTEITLLDRLRAQRELQSEEL